MANCNTYKRIREETAEQNDDDQVCVVGTDAKKHKTFNHILSLLDDEEEEPTQDLSSLITTLQQELSSEYPISLTDPSYDQEAVSSTQLTTTIEDYASSESSSSSSCNFLKEDDDDDKESVIKHLLEASDHELGIPNREEVFNGYEDEKDGFSCDGDGGFPLSCDGLWEFEDVNANYYTLLQSELFM